ncbi:uncharacterized protein BKA55DRAFT_496883, partial [Fusarium redolens]
LQWPDEDINLDEVLTNVLSYWFTDTMPRCIYTYRVTFINGHKYFISRINKPFGYSWFIRELALGSRKVV